MSLFQRTSLGLGALLIVLMALPGLLNFGGFQMVAVSGQSMGQSVPDQSIVVTRSVDGASLRTGDVIVFRADWLDGAANVTNVVHRLSVITSTPAGLLGYTSGDANRISDPAPVSLGGELSLVMAVVPLAGVFYGLSSSGLFFMALGLVLIPLLVSIRSGLTSIDFSYLSEVERGTTASI